MADLVMLDSCIIIDIIEQREPTHTALGPFLRRSEAGTAKVVVSSISLAEVKYLRNLSAQGLSQERQNDLIERWFDNDYVHVRNADRATCAYAGQLAQRASARHESGKNLAGLDAIVLATALSARVEVLVTNDDGRKSKNIGLLELTREFGNPPLEIRKPTDLPGQTDLM